MLSSVIILICTFITCNSCINNLREYGILTILKDLPNRLTFSTFILPSIVVTNCIGPSAKGDKKIFNALL